MRNRVGLFLVGVSLAIPCHSATTAFATGEVQNPITDSFNITNTYDEHFTLLVTGGTGTGRFASFVSASGEVTDYGAQISNYWATAYSYVDDSDGGGAGISAPNDDGTSGSCQVNLLEGYNGCGWDEFTFGVPEDLHVTGKASVGYACATPRFLSDCQSPGEPVTASASFNGIGDFMIFYPGVKPPEQIFPSYTLTEVSDAGPTYQYVAPTDTPSDPTGAPEPGSIALMVSGVAGLLYRRRSVR